MDSLDAAALETWSLDTDTLGSFRDGLTNRLVSGAFHYVIIAQRFTDTMVRSIDYLNATTAKSQFFAVELVKFASDDGKLHAFEGRTMARPTRQVRQAGSTGYIDEATFLESIDNDEYREAVREILEASRGLGYKPEWGSRGPSIRLRTQDRTEPVSAMWIYPPATVGWMDLRDSTLGFDPSQCPENASARPAFERFVSAARDIVGAEAVEKKSVRGAHLAVAVVIAERDRIKELLATLSEQIQA